MPPDLVYNAFLLFPKPLPDANKWPNPPFNPVAFDIESKSLLDFHISPNPNELMRDAVSPAIDFYTINTF